MEETKGERWALCKLCIDSKIRAGVKLGDKDGWWECHEASHVETSALAFDRRVNQEL